jgi:hypothetical protein
MVKHTPRPTTIWLYNTLHIRTAINLRDLLKTN